MSDLNGPKRKSWPRRHKLLTALGTVVVLGGGCGVALAGLAGSGGTSSTAPAAVASSAPARAGASSLASPSSAPSAQAKVGTPVRDGKFEFTVTKVEPGKSRVGSRDFGTTAQGQFVFVRVTVENVGNEPQSLFGDNQKLFDAQGREFSPDTEAAIYLQDSNSLYEEINPGNTVKGVIVYDIPKAAKPARLELHDSAFSGGAEVRL